MTITCLFTCVAEYFYYKRRLRVASTQPPTNQIMKQKNQMDENVMIKCKKFLFEPTDNKIVNFCYEIGQEFGNGFGRDSEQARRVGEEQVDEATQQEACADVDGHVSEEVTGQVDGNGFIEYVSEQVRTEVCSPVFELVEEPVIAPTVSVLTDDSVIAPAVSEQVNAPVVSERVIAPVVSEPVFTPVDSIESISHEKIENIGRPETPMPTTVPEPTSPEENRMLRNMKISDGTSYTIAREKFHDFVRAKQAVEEDKRKLKQYWDEFDARVEIMAKHEINLKAQLEEQFQVRVNEMSAMMGQIEAAYKQELMQERAARMQMESKMNEMAAFIQQNMQNNMNDCQRGMMDYREENQNGVGMNMNYHQQQVNYNIQQQQEAIHQQHQQQVNYQQQQEFMHQQYQQQQQELMRQQHQQQEQQQQYQHQQAHMNQGGQNRQISPPSAFALLGNERKSIAQLENEDFQRKEMEWQKMRQEQKQQQLEMEKQRIKQEEMQREEQRRMEMRKMQHMRHVEMSKAPSVDPRLKIKEEQEKLMAAQEEKGKFDPFALLKKVPNVFGWNKNGPTEPLNPPIPTKPPVTPVKPIPHMMAQKDPMPDPLMTRKANGVRLSPQIEPRYHPDDLAKQSKYPPFDIELFKRNTMYGLRMEAEMDEERKSSAGKADNGMDTDNPKPAPADKF